MYFVVFQENERCNRMRTCVEIFYLKEFLNFFYSLLLFIEICKDLINWIFFHV